MQEITTHAVGGKSPLRVIDITKDDAPAGTHRYEINGFPGDPLRIHIGPAGITPEALLAVAHHALAQEGKGRERAIEAALLQMTRPGSTKGQQQQPTAGKKKSSGGANSAKKQQPSPAPLRRDALPASSRTLEGIRSAPNAAARHKARQGGAGPSQPRG